MSDNQIILKEKKSKIVAFISFMFGLSSAFMALAQLVTEVCLLFTPISSIFALIGLIFAIKVFKSEWKKLVIIAIIFNIIGLSGFFMLCSV
jgi:hypothetical protein